MKTKTKLIFSTLFLFISTLQNANSENIKSEKEDKCNQEKTSEKKGALKEEVVETKHLIKLNGADFSYKATAGTMLLRDEGDNVKGSMFYIAYVKDESNAQRPITFCFNGGPGSSSVWLHMGVFGPKRVALDDEGKALVPNHLVENEYTILDATDLVFIDPISTGYSRPSPGEDVKQFHGVDEDIKAVAEFIRLYVTKNGRWDSPKFLAGESYGTTRASGLVGYLHDEYCMYSNGIILVSSILNFQTSDFNEGNDLPYVMFLPSYTATAWYHKKLSPDLQEKDLTSLLLEVKQFAETDYILALMKGDLLEDKDREIITQKLASYTGLSPYYIEENNLRVTETRFAKELLRSQRRVVGRFDGRFKGINYDSAGESCGLDPSLEIICGAFTANFNQYARKELKWEKDDNYKILANVWPWNWTYGKSVNQYLYVANTLREVMEKNPKLRIFVANGYYDLATPFFGTEYTFYHLGLDPSLRGHVSMGYYDAGHMMYIYKPMLIKFSQDVHQFIMNTLEAQKSD